MTEYRPFVAVVAYHLGEDRVARWPRGGYGVPLPYINRLREAGCRTSIVAPGEPGTPAEILEPYDGLVLVGGGDVDPARYGAEPDEAHNYGVEPARDDFEIALLHEARAQALPTLCICRGMQVMNVAFGGTLHQHLPDLEGVLPHGVPLEDTESTHDVETERRSRVWACTKTTTLQCSSHHHQGVDRVGSGLAVTGRSPDGLVEAIELDAPLEDVREPWMLGVQWHPEDTAATDPAQQSLFDGLAFLARIRGTRRGQGEQEGKGRAYEIVPHDPSWSQHFDREADRLRSALGGTAVHIEHVGSTAVPGLAAKPIVDIQVSVASMEPRIAYLEPLVELGYRHVVDPVDPTHEFFNHDVDGRRAFNLHVCPTGSDWERRHVAFRDALRADPDLTAEYGELKRRLAREHPRDAYSYTDAKAAFIVTVERDAVGRS